MTTLPEDAVELLAGFVPRQDLAAMRPIVRGPLVLIPRLLGVEATALGKFVLFRSKRYNPDTARGLGLIAHEAVHIRQYREIGWLRFLFIYGFHRVRTRSRGMSHPLEAPCIELQRSVVAALRSRGWP